MLNPSPRLGRLSNVGLKGRRHAEKADHGDWSSATGACRSDDVQHMAVSFWRMLGSKEAVRLVENAKSTM